MGIKSFISGLFSKKRGAESIIGSYPNKPRVSPSASIKKKKKQLLTEGKTKTSVKPQNSVRSKPTAPPPAPKKKPRTRSERRRTNVQKGSGLGTALAAGLLANEILDDSDDREYDMPFNEGNEPIINNSDEYDRPYGGEYGSDDSGSYNSSDSDGSDDD